MARRNHSFFHDNRQLATARLGDRLVIHDPVMDFNPLHDLRSRVRVNWSARPIPWNPRTAPSFLDLLATVGHPHATFMKTKVMLEVFLEWIGKPIEFRL